MMDVNGETFTLEIVDVAPGSPAGWTMAKYQWVLWRGPSRREQLYARHEYLAAMHGDRHGWASTRRGCRRHARRAARSFVAAETGVGGRLIVETTQLTLRPH